MTRFIFGPDGGAYISPPPGNNEGTPPVKASDADVEQAALEGIDEATAALARQKLAEPE